MVLAVWALFASPAFADTFQMANGDTITGEALPSAANAEGIQVKLAEGKYERIPWINFSQEDLKKFKENPKLAPLVDPFIEVTQEERIKKTEVVIKQPPRLELPPKKSLFGAMFSSGPGLFLLLLLYAAIIYAGYEVAIFRGRPVPLVAGLSAIPFLGFFAPIVFLCIPTKVERATAPWETTPEQAAGQAVGQGAPQAAGAEGAVNPMLGEGVEHPTGLKLHTEAQPAKPQFPPTQVFQRGQYTFNKRFIETKFANFFSVVRREGEKDMLLIIKAARGEYIGERITRIASNDLHLQVHRGGASEEVLIPFQEIKEIVLKHKDAP